MSLLVLHLTNGNVCPSQGTTCTGDGGQTVLFDLALLLLVMALLVGLAFWVVRTLRRRNASCDNVEPTGIPNTWLLRSRLRTPGRRSGQVKFIVGVIVGFGIGVASSIVYSGQTGKDLREVYGDRPQERRERRPGTVRPGGPVERRAGPGAGPGRRHPGPGEGGRSPRKSGGNGTATDEPIPETTTE